MKDRVSSSLFPCLVDALIAYSLCTKEAYRTDMDKRVGGWGGSAGGSEGGSGEDSGQDTEELKGLRNPE